MSWTGTTLTIDGHSPLTVVTRRWLIGFAVQFVLLGVLAGVLATWLVLS